MKNVVFEIPKRSDRQIIESIKRVFNEYGQLPSLLRLHLFIETELICSFNEIDINPDLKGILTYDTELIEVFNVDLLAQSQITIHRQAAKTTDRVTVNYSQLNQNDYLRLIALAKRELHAFDPLRSWSRSIDDETKVHYEIREMELERLQQIAEQVTKNTDTYRHELDQLLLKKIAENDAHLAKKIAEVDEKQKLAEEELAKQRAAVEEKFKHIDDRENTHARRQLRGELKSELQKRQSKFELTEGTRKLRRPIQRILVTLLIVFGGLLILFSFETYGIIVGFLSVPTNVAMTIIIRQILLTISFAGTSIYYLRWTNQWFQHHADEEFRTKRFDIDIDRASWVVEMALEWRKEKGTDIPIELLDKLMQNLFVEPVAQPEVKHPVEQFASALLGASSSVKLKTGNGAELMLDRKGIGKIIENEKN